MKKVIAIIAALSVSLLSVKASAQDGQLFNHASLGITLGIDGLGAEAVVPATPYLQVRGGYSFMPFAYKQDLNLEFFSHPLPISASMWDGGLGKLMLDVFPGEDTPLKFVAGAFFGSGKLASATVDLTSYLDPEDYGVGISRNGATISTDKDGIGHLEAQVWNILPYLGLGIGRALDPDKRIGFSVDLGAAFTGGIKFAAYDYSTPGEPQAHVISSGDLTDDDGTMLDSGIVDTISAISVLPMLRFGVYVRLF